MNLSHYRAEIVQRRLDTITPYDRNPYLHTDEAVVELAHMIQIYGFDQPIVVDGDGVIIKGHRRRLAALHLGLTTVPVVVRTDLDPITVRAARIADNESRKSEIDKLLMAREVLDIKDGSAELTQLLGMNVKALESLLKPVVFNKQGEADPVESPQGEEGDGAPIPSSCPERVKPGDVWQLGRHTLVCGNSGDQGTLARLSNGAHALVSDPPYGLEFMGKSWDYDVPKTDLWTLWAERLLPGAHALVFGGTRTYHRMVVALEDAGFEIRDQMQWLYGQGFPKSLDVSKAIDKEAGAERERETPQRRMNPSVAIVHGGFGADGFAPQVKEPITAAAAAAWNGWGTALKPANEPICVARKPCSEDTVAENVLKHGTGALNIDASRIEGAIQQVPQPSFNSPTGKTYGMKCGEGRNGEMSRAEGRFPANVVLSHSEGCEPEHVFADGETQWKCAEGCAARALDEQSGQTTSPTKVTRGFSTNPTFAKFGPAMSGKHDAPYEVPLGYGDTGGASRFFYCAKASKSDRGGENTHATVKPLKLMEYLVRLVTPPGGTVFEPFAGSGTTLLACETQGFICHAAELDPRHCDIILSRWEKMTGLHALKTDDGRAE